MQHGPINDAAASSSAAASAHKYTSNMLNPSTINKRNFNITNAMFAANQTALLVLGQDPLTPTMLANVPPEKQKQMLGERLYPLVRDFNPSRCGKITGMLLEMDNSDLLNMLENELMLKKKMEEALRVVNTNQAIYQPRGSRIVCHTPRAVFISGNKQRGICNKAAIAYPAPSTHNYTSSKGNPPAVKRDVYIDTDITASTRQTDVMFSDPFTPTMLADASPEKQKQCEANDCTL